MDYAIYRCKEFPNLVRVPTQLAHKTRVTYHPIIQFTPEEILKWWCDCPITSGYLECCSDIAEAIWFLSYERRQDNGHRMPSGNFINLAIGVGQQSEFYESTKDEQDNNKNWFVQ